MLPFFWWYIFFLQTRFSEIAIATKYEEISLLILTCLITSKLFFFQYTYLSPSFLCPASIFSIDICVRHVSPASFILYLCMSCVSSLNFYFIYLCPVCPASIFFYIFMMYCPVRLLCHNFFYICTYDLLSCPIFLIYLFLSWVVTTKLITSKISKRFIHILWHS